MTFSYNADPAKEEKRFPAPSKVHWSLEVEKIGHGNMIHVKVLGQTPTVDNPNLEEHEPDQWTNEVYGFLRLPNEDYLKYLRERIQKR